VLLAGELRNNNSIALSLSPLGDRKPEGGEAEAEARRARRSLSDLRAREEKRRKGKAEGISAD